MDIYALARPLLFKLDAETAHQFTLMSLDLTYRLKLLDVLYPPVEPITPVSLMGLNFSNRVGLAAGLDKNGEHIDALAALGFGFIEVGTVTPRPQPGNPKPRLFRLPEHEAIINRMGFNNKGIDYLLDQVKRSRYRGILGINIGKNFDTPIENAVDDYLIGLRKAYASANYITINISSPNTKNLRQLQQANESRRLLSGLKEEQIKLAQEYRKQVPLLLKIAPDLSADEIGQIAGLLVEFGIEGVIATNTTIDRDAVAGHPLAQESGGLSGKPVRAKSTEVIRLLSQELAGKVPVIGVGGILSSDDAKEKINAGASLVQIYSGLIYRGPSLVREISRTLSD